MLTRDEARAKIAELVERFRATPISDREGYNETQTRHYFILPLFRALGWDTENPADMTSEEQISRGFVDFGFYLDGVPRFYVETKKIPADLDDPRWGQQAINYSYLKGVTWAVLTDFEGLKVYNAEWEETNPQRAIFLDLRWEDYAGSGFDRLWLLSKESIRAGEIDRKAEEVGRKVKKRPVTEQLFAQLTQWRRELFPEIRHFDNTLWSNDPRAVDNAVQRLLDRLIFIRSVEDRGIEAPRLRPLARQYDRRTGKGKNLFGDLQGLFRELDGVYNANLFAESTIDHVNIYNPDLLISIINGLYEAPGGFISYDFNAIDADVLGSIYEQYLGWKEYDKEGKEAIELGKRQKRKSQGIYYTPQFVVRYIVQNTLGRLLEEGADPHALRILDPACGSGSFLIEAFDVLDRWLAKNGTPQDREFPQQRRLRILRENLYGVDLDDQAVEVARLNLLLRAASKREKLPMLANLRRGNSLIDDPAVAGDAAFRWEQEFPEVFAAGGFDVVVGNPPYVRQEWLSEAKDYFEHTYETFRGTADLYVYFIEKEHKLLKPTGRFGMIVSNKWMKAAYGKPLRQFLAVKASLEEVVDLAGLPVFEEATVRTVILLSRPQPGHVTHVRYCPPPTLDEFENLRNERGLAALVTQNAAQYPVQYLGADSWSLADAGATALIERLKRDFTSLNEYAKGAIYRGVLSGYNEAFVIDRPTRDRLIQQDPRSAQIIKPVLGGRDVRRYVVNYSERYLIFARRGIDITHYPAVLEHLKTFERELTPKQSRNDGFGRKPGDYAWYEIQDTVDYYPEFEKPKIIYPDIATECRFALDKRGHFGSNTTYFMPVADLYLLGLLNSQLGLFYFTQACAALEGGKDKYLRFFGQYIKDFPIPVADNFRYDRMVTLVTQMLALTKQHAEADAAFDDRRHDLARRIEQLDREIDQLVYELYGLTADEIAIVEGQA